VNSAEDNCTYLVNKSKCDCSQHKTLRNNVKAINFGLAYGMGPNKLADNLQISKDEAKSLIKRYFKSFPSIGGFLDKLGTFGKRYGYIKTFPPYNRKRWFDTWYDKIWNHRSSVMELGTIERASKNTPIQGASADMTKLALVYIHEYIKENNIPVKMVMTVHDQIDTICKDSYSKTWKKQMTELMELAANQIVQNGLLKADTKISKTWEK
jgi:DNA polymerase-1